MTNVLGPSGIKAFQNRQIDPAIAAHSGVFTGSVVTSESGESAVEPDPNGNIVVFPFIDGGKPVGEKYRAPGKKFWQRRGGRKTFWNADCMDDPALEDGRKALIITEGEIDALTAIDCGFHCAVSVPDGAPPVREGEDPETLEDANPDDDRHGKFEFVYNNQAYRRSPKARFMFADLTLAAIRKLKDGQGNYLWQMGDVKTNQPGTLLGYGYSINDDMDALAAAKKVMIFGDLSKYFVRKVGSPVIGVLRERFWPDLGIAGLIRFDGELGDTAAVKHLITAAT